MLDRLENMNVFEYDIATNFIINFDMHAILLIFIMNPGFYEIIRIKNGAAERML